MPKCLYNKQEMTAGEMFWELRVDGEVVTGLAEGSGPMKEMLKKKSRCLESRKPILLKILNKRS